MPNIGRCRVSILLDGLRDVPFEFTHHTSLVSTKCVSWSPPMPTEHCIVVDMDYGWHNPLIGILKVQNSIILRINTS